jgi:hypothetical protein
MVPEECINRPYERLFKFLLERNLVSLGLYRLPQSTDNNYPYVYTNPDSKTIVTFRDRVFVLGKDIPKDLMTDQNNNINILVNNESNKVSKKETQ